MQRKGGEYMKKGESSKQKEVRSLLHKAIKVSIRTSKELEASQENSEKYVLSGINTLEYYGDSALIEYDFSGETSGEHKTVEKRIYANTIKKEN